MFYIRGTHRQYGNVVWLEIATPLTTQFKMARPTPDVLCAEALTIYEVEVWRSLFSRYYPDYHWIPVGADSDALIPENMRRLLKLA